jgi:type 1 glutamine amidotransferase
VRTDEWYRFQTNPRGQVDVLMHIDLDHYTAQGAPPEVQMVGDHPIAWYHHFDGGRAFYTALGHTPESYAEPAFIDHVAGGVEWAAGHDTPLGP